MSVWDALWGAVGRLLGGKPPEPPPARAVMHWRPVPGVLGVACGEEGFVRWTADLAHSDCEGCKARGRLMILQRKVNTR